MQSDRVTLTACGGGGLAASDGLGDSAEPLGVSLLYRLARTARRRSSVHSPADLPRTTEEGKYRSWRSQELRRQLTEHFDTGLVEARDVLDFGCGTGELCTCLAEYGPSSLVGVDKSPDRIRTAAAITEATASRQGRPKFFCNERDQALPLEEGSLDLICCFDVVEHIPQPQAVAREWRRVLRPGGRIWIWWSPWRGPFGHHLESLIPLPWVHLVLPPRLLFSACARLYDDPDFVPRLWDRDPISGEKKANKWRHTRSFSPFLNKLTRCQFERSVRAAGLIVTRRETHGFSGSGLRRATRLLLPVPFLGECLTSYYIYELTKA